MFNQDITDFFTVNDENDARALLIDLHDKSQDFFEIRSDIYIESKRDAQIFLIKRYNLSHPFKNRFSFEMGNLTPDSNLVYDNGDLIFPTHNQVQRLEGRVWTSLERPVSVTADDFISLNSLEVYVGKNIENYFSGLNPKLDAQFHCVPTYTDLALALKTLGEPLPQKHAKRLLTARKKVLKELFDARNSSYDKSKVHMLLFKAEELALDQVRTLTIDGRGLYCPGVIAGLINEYQLDETENLFNDKVGKLLK
ncbi:MAG: hypothetical protein U9R08_03915 [Nanoarchaeota archaeon]|nr:hypothetical protein [Nanoarchaeota archaeon]